MSFLETLQPLVLGAQYTLRMATSREEVRQAQALRFDVFNREMNEGLSSSIAAQLDVDAFDAVCDHLLVEHASSQRIVGTYRMQSGVSAKQNLGYYTAQEFNLDVFEMHRPHTIELGRACIHIDHRNYQVLSMLWRGIASYAKDHGARYLIGCSSLSSQDPAQGMAAYASMRTNLAPIEFRTQPNAGFICPQPEHTLSNVKIPKLLSAYLSLGAWICGPPAIDREFNTIDFLTLMDLQSEGMATRRKRFGINC
jgi:putative hemolysin